MIPEDTVLNFAAALFKSVWALDVLIALRNGRTRAWQADEIIRELRGSRLVVEEALKGLLAAGLVVEEDDGSFRYQPASGMEEMVGELEKLYAIKPTAVIKKIASSPDVKLQILSDAFRIKE
jgi:predicted transcriptional regulator